ncbi:hypothetical protein B0T25DRAFT_455493 [Lasiosphaeria hispida]|uniref:Homeobox protein 4 n=1 Tax=Lasiosphaeria hispida TaxID=260671 RepID=A0AAJ0HIC2_9PEZI|nr:hypothetical protein B0T25DRAFT_455493 [Lasiosphaeria hispida]
MPTSSHGHGDPLQDVDLMLEDVDGDNFGFWAIQHFENSNLTALDGTFDMALPAETSPKVFEESFAPNAPSDSCAHCQMGGYECKRIREGKYKGYCTSCVALRCGCSFGLAKPTPYPSDLTSAVGADGILATGVVSKPVARFSREAVKILKNWLSTHTKHPYPNEEEKQILQKQTGLDKTQITNWLANARRRKKKNAPRSTSPGIQTWANGIDIPRRRGTPAPLELMNPLQRWEVSPPEHEPASVTAIARAVTASSNLSSGLNSPYSFNLTDDGSNKSHRGGPSSASSVDVSHSSGSFASAWSHASRNSFSSLDRGRRRRRRRAATRATEGKAPLSTSLSTPLKAFMCTFCTETFRTKHDWQRHEKSLHLSLERWVCTPEGPRAFNPENGQVSCVFCGEANPDEDHVESHNHSACQERTLGERTFYRKDHLRQHLKLVHSVKFVNWSMEQWKVATPEIRSRCGFCGIVMDTWTIRVDHLAEHFKTGTTMADWKGDWGFEAPVLDMVENSIPPYLIHDERNSPDPFQASSGASESARNAYELIKSELMFYVVNQRDMEGRSMPTDEELQLEACRIIFGSEVLSQSGISAKPAWLRDLILSSDQITLRGQLAPIRSHADSRQAQLKINGKDNIFENDAMETELQEYVKARRMLGLTAMDHELQVEACNIISRIEESSNHPSDEIANFLLRLIYSSTAWLAGFRQRAGLPRSEDVENEAKRSNDPNTIDSTIHNYSRLEAELAEYVHNQRSMGTEPSDADLQRQARIIVYEFDDNWNQTAADNMAWLSAFKERHISTESSAAALARWKEPLTISSVMRGECDMDTGTCSRKINNYISGSKAGAGTGTEAKFKAVSSPVKVVSGPVRVGAFFLNDSNCYHRLAHELGRYVASAVSPNNPNSHIPTDEELQHQARWISFDDDDPWNQTPADNAEWLRRFKRDVGILTDPSLPGLPPGKTWNISQGGSGFAPPYVFPNPNAPIKPFEEGLTPVATCEGSKLMHTDSATANKYLSTFTTRQQPPAVVFCSRELENGLAEFVTGQVALLGYRAGAAAAFPDDEAIRARAREIIKTSRTPADDPVLLEKFKEMMREKLGLAASAPSQGQSQEQGPTQSHSLLSGTGAGPPPPLSLDMGLTPQVNLDFTEGELNDILQDMDFDFGDMVDFGSDQSPPLGDVGQL